MSTATVAPTPANPASAPVVPQGNAAAGANPAGNVPPNPYASASLYVGDLAPDVNESVLFEIFSVAGPVASVRVCRDTLTRRSLGYAYVNFHDMRDAERALDTLNFTNIRDRQCRVMWSHRDPSLRRSGAGNIYVKNLDKSIDSKTMYDTFSVFGDILSCKVVTNSKLESLGYGFVHFESEDSAKRAIANVDGKMIANKIVSVQPFKPKKEREGNQRTFTNIYVKNLPSSISSQEKLDELFAKFGEITSSYLPMDEKNEKAKGFGFINFAKHEDAEHAIEALHETEIDGSKLYVTKAQKKSERERELRVRFDQLRQERQQKFSGVNLYVKNLSETITNQRLIDEFKEFGDITSACVMLDQNNRSKCFGFVCFSNSESATKAVTAMNGKMVDNKPLYVALAQPKEVRRAALEARFNNRMKVPFMAPYPPQNFFFQGMAPQRAMMFPPMGPQQRMRWTPQGGQIPQPQGRGAPMGAMGMGVGGYSGVSGMGPNQRPMQRGRGRGGLQRGGRGGMMGAPQGRGQPQVQGPQQLQHVARVGPNAQQTPQGAAFNYTNQARNRPAPVPNQVAMPPQPINLSELSQLPVDKQKKIIGERLFQLIQQQQPQMAGKLTGMLLEIDDTHELIHLLESADALNDKLSEAIDVLEKGNQEENSYAEENNN